MMLLFLIGILSIYSTGYVIRRSVYIKEPSLLSGVEKFGVDFGFGSGALALIFFYLSFFGARIGPGVMLGTGAMFLAASIIIKFSCMKRGKLMDPVFPAKRKTGKLNLILVIIMVLSVSVILFKSAYYPMYEWASRSCFGFKAKILNDSGTIYDRSLLDKEFVLEHPEYPLLVPMLEDWMYTVMRTRDDRFGKTFLPFMAMAFLCLIYGIQRKFCDKTHSLSFTALYSLVYVFVYRFACAEADAPLAFFYFGAGAFLLLWIHFDRIPYLISSSLFTAFAVFTKNEATSFFLILSTCLLLSIPGGGRPLGRKMAAAALYVTLTIILSAPWLIYRLTLLPVTDVLVTEETFFNAGALGSIAAKFGRTAEIINNFAFDIVLKTRKWNFFWILFLAAQLIYPKELFKKPVIYLTFIVWSTLGLYYLMFVMVNLELDHMLIGMDRFGLQVSGLVLLLTSLLVRERHVFIGKPGDL